MNKKNYRLFLLFSSTTSADTMNDFMKKITEILNDFGVTILETEQGKPFTLAYPINGITEGIQVVSSIEMKQNNLTNIIIREFTKLITQYCREYLLRLKVFNENHIIFETINPKKANEEQATEAK